MKFVRDYIFECLHYSQDSNMESLKWRCVSSILIFKDGITEMTLCQLTQRHFRNSMFESWLYSQYPYMESRKWRYELTQRNFRDSMFESWE